MTLLKRCGAVAATGAAITSSVILTGGPGTAAADNTNAGSTSKYTPLSPYLRRCDFTAAGFVPTAAKGTGNATITRTGNTVSAEVRIITAAPDIFYGVRLIQTPRRTLGCGPNDPGVAMGRLYTDANGTGTVTVRGPVMDGATGAWVSVEGPLGNADMLSGDFRTSDFVAAI